MKNDITREFVDGYKILVSQKEEYPFAYVWWSVFKFGHLCAEGRIYKGNNDTGLLVAKATVKELIELEEKSSVI